MLLLGSKTFTIDGMTIFSDHADPNQFWYLPAPVALETRPDGKDLQLSLLVYRPEVAAAGVKGGGFLMFTAALPLDRTEEERLRSQIATVFPDVTDPRLSLVPFDEGSVQCVSLNLQGPGGTVAPAAPAAVPGAFNAVETIHGASTPSLMGNNDALFSLTLSEEGATLLQKSFEEALEPIGVIYQLKYTGVRPALDVEIVADLKRAYDAFSVGLTAEAYYVTVGIDATWEKLVQDGAIKVKVTNLAPNDADNRTPENWALQLFKDNLINDWFKPSLSPTTTGAAVDAGKQADADAKANFDADKAAKDKAAADAKAANDKAAADAKAAQDKADKLATDAKTAADKATTLKTAADKAAADAKAAADKFAKSNDPNDKKAADAAAAAAKTAADASDKAAKDAKDAKDAADKAAADAKAAAGKGGSSSGATDALGKAIDKAADKLLPKGVNPANSAAGAAPYGAALRMRYVNEEEKKTVTITYTRQDAVQRTYAPQGYFGAFLSKADESKYVKLIDLDNPFFRKLDVTATPPRYFSAFGLRSVHVAID